MRPLGEDGLPLTPEGDAKRDHAVIRFRRAVNFPRFGMAEGERFEFAGGLCLADDVEVLYVGQRGSDEAVNAGRSACKVVDDVA